MISIKLVLNMQGIRGHADKSDIAIGNEFGNELPFTKLITKFEVRTCLWGTMLY
jgi:hypothetical protein